MPQCIRSDISYRVHSFARSVRCIRRFENNRCRCRRRRHAHKHRCKRTECNNPIGNFCTAWHCFSIEKIQLLSLNIAYAWVCVCVCDIRWSFFPLGSFMSALLSSSDDCVMTFFCSLQRFFVVSIQFPVFPWLCESILQCWEELICMQISASLRNSRRKCAFAKHKSIRIIHNIWAHHISNVNWKLLLVFVSEEKTAGKRNYDLELRTTHAIKRKIVALQTIFSALISFLLYSCLVVNFINFFTMQSHVWWFSVCSLTFVLTHCKWE